MQQQDHKTTGTRGLRPVALAPALAARLAELKAKGVQPAPLVEDAPSCAACGDLHWVKTYVSETETRVSRCLACAPELTPGGQFSRFIIPNDYSTAAQEQLRWALTAARDMAEVNTPRWLVLIGHLGCGKTSIARAVVTCRKAMGQSAAYFTADSLIDSFRSTQAPGAWMSMSEWMAYLEHLDLLVVDEMGAEWAGKNQDGELTFAKTKLERLLIARNEREAATIICSNKAPDGDRSPFPERIVSRLRDQDVCQVISLVDVPDFRTRKVAH